MGNLRLGILWLLWVLFARRSVVLIDYDGEPNARMLRGFRKWWWAKRHLNRVQLLPDGKTEGICYVHGWEPLFPDNFTIDSH